MEKTNRLLYEILDWLKWILGALILGLLINNFVLINANIPTGSMATTINPGDKVMGLRLAYLLSEPKRGDIIIFKMPDDETLPPYVKRLIGLPGETVEITEGSVLINGTPLPEPYLHTTTNGHFGPYEVPEGHYFFLGDNRGNSLDSRYWSNTFVAKKKLMGKVLFKYSPEFMWYSN